MNFTHGQVNPIVAAETKEGRPHANRDAALSIERGDAVSILAEKPAVQSNETILGDRASFLQVMSDVADGAPVSVRVMPF